MSNLQVLQSHALARHDADRYTCVVADNVIRTTRVHGRHGGRLLSGLYRQPANWDNLRPSGSIDWLLIATVSGCGYVRAGDSEVRLPRGSLLCYQPGVAQEYGSDSAGSGWDLLWFHMDIRPAWPNWLQWPEIAPGVLHLAIEAEDTQSVIINALHDAHSAACKRTTTGIELASNAIERALLLAHETTEWADAESQVDQRVKRALDFIAANSHRPLTLSELADHCGISNSQLSHLFRDQVGIAPIRFHEQQRLQRAADLLRQTNLSIGEVASEVGFDDSFHFSTRFRKQFSASPRAFRAQA